MVVLLLLQHSNLPILAYSDVLPLYVKCRLRAPDYAILKTATPVAVVT